MSKDDCWGEVSDDHSYCRGRGSAVITIASDACDRAIAASDCGGKGAGIGSDVGDSYWPS